MALQHEKKQREALRAENKELRREVESLAEELSATKSSLRAARDASKQAHEVNTTLQVRVRRELAVVVWPRGYLHCIASVSLRCWQAGAAP